eukprot:COSAG02_NODE_44113_length_369_cov_0.403704_1_plen_46_part_10
MRWTTRPPSGVGAQLTKLQADARDAHVRAVGEGAALCASRACVRAR